MKTLKYLFIISLVFLITGCIKRTFYPDVDDPGLSRFTAHQYNVGTAYIKGEAYINYWPSNSSFLSTLPYPILSKIPTNSSSDTLNFSWRIELKDTSKASPNDYEDISIQMPIEKTFSLNDLLAWNGEQLTNDMNTLVLYDKNRKQLKGTANIFFVKIENSSAGYLYVSGLFNGNIGDSILITKGRFDYIVKTNL